MPTGGTTGAGAGHDHRMFASTLETQAKIHGRDGGGNFTKAAMAREAAEKLAAHNRASTTRLFDTLRAARA